jgi:5'-3' exonuclease
MKTKHYLIDCSYICYFAGFSAFKQYCYNFDILNSDLGPDFDPTLDSEFCHIFNETIKYSIFNPLLTNFPIIDKSKIIFCMDCPRKNIWRREIFPGYKLDRDLQDPSKQKFNLSRMFKYAYDIIIPNFCDEYEAKQLRCGCAEGDDIIAVMTKHFLNETKDEVIIVSCDKDMVQLANDRVTILTAEGMKREPKLELEKAIKQKIQEDITCNDFLLFKILIGDTADGIPNVKSGIGPKKAWKYIQDKNLLKSLLSEDITVADGFMRNKRLISMNEIPKQVCELILEQYESVNI